MSAPPKEPLGPLAAAAAALERELAGLGVEHDGDALAQQLQALRNKIALLGERLRSAQAS